MDECIKKNMISNENEAVIMQDFINRRVTQMKVTGIREFSYKVAEYPDAIDLTVGQPDFDTPQHIKDYAQQAIKKNNITYSHNAGLFELRKAASEFVYKKYQLSYDPKHEVIITNGASEGIDTAFRTILEEGSEVILPGPIYPAYEPLIRLCGATPVFVDTSTNHFKINAEMIRNKLTEKTRCIVLSYPSNPIGSILERQDLIEIANLLHDKKIFVLSDEIYSELTYDSKHISIASMPGMRERTIVINGLAKSHSMTGWRIGYTLAPAFLSNEMLKVHLYNCVCASTVSQYAAIEALTNGIDDALIMKEEYKKRRDYVFDRIVSMGLEAIKPKGAFYLFPSIKATGMKSFDFAMQLLEEARVAVVPGNSFSDLGEGYVRISYAYSMEILEEGLNRMEQFIRSRNTTFI